MAEETRGEKVKIIMEVLVFFTYSCPPSRKSASLRFVYRQPRHMLSDAQSMTSLQCIQHNGDHIGITSSGLTRERVDL